MPHKGKDRATALNEALNSGYTTVLYESPHRLEKLLNELVSVVPQQEIFLAKEITKRYQRFLRGTAQELLELLDKNFKGEWVVVLKANKKQNISAITQKDILSLELSKKQQAKLISKITGENTKECYQRLLTL